MKIIFAQGNPGSQYTNSRHNLGFTMLDRLAQDWDVKFLQKPKLHALIAEYTYDKERILLVKPTTFYNETGQSARTIIEFYKVDPTVDFLVIHDDLALPFGNIRTRRQGSDAGNNGIKSLNAHLGSNYARIRIGIYNELRDKLPDADFVLAAFSTHERTALNDIYALTESFIADFIKNTFETTKIAITELHS